jgi:DNA-cytosine methyltransferase
MQGELDPRGSLFYEIIRIAEVKKPKYMLLENVKGLTCKKFKDTFNKILSELDRIGYSVYWKVLNSKDFGIPQSMARVWFVCFRKDIDTKTFKFPEPVELKIFIKDILEPQVDSKYYLSPLLQERFAKYLEEKNRKLGEQNPAILDLYNHKIKTDGTSITLSDPCHNNLRLIEGTEVCNLQPRTGRGLGGKGLLSKNDGTAYCIARDSGQAVVANCIKKSGIPTKPEYFYEKKNGNFVMGTITQAFGRRGHSKEELDMYDKLGQLRRLTPKECFRLMGFLNDEINLYGLSDTQKYKLAGNGWDINLASKILKNMF